MKIYKDFVLASSNYLSRADESGLDITGDLTLGCWVYFDAESTDVETGIISKWYETGNQRAYVLYKSAANVLTFSVSDDGENVFSITDFGANYVDSQWFYVVGRFTSITEMALFVNGLWYREPITSPATLKNSTEAFEIGRYNRTNYLDGRVSHAFICAYAVPDRFICAMFAHSRAMYMSKLIYNNPCMESSSSSYTSSSTSSSSTITSSSSSTTISSSSSSTTITSSSSSESYSYSTSTSSSTSSSTTCSSSSSSSSTTTSSSSTEIP